MGCDIHWYSETRKEGVWECDQAASFVAPQDDEEGPDMTTFPNRGRDYWMFGLLQPDVRSDWDWSFPERVGLPEGTSEEIQALSDAYDPDGHSHGYVTRAEIKEKLEDLKLHMASHLLSPQDTTEALFHHVTRLKEILANLSAGVPDTDQRLVFWFDN